MEYCENFSQVILTNNQLRGRGAYPECRKACLDALLTHVERMPGKIKARPVTVREVLESLIQKFSEKLWGSAVSLKDVLIGCQDEELPTYCGECAVCLQQMDIHEACKLQCHHTFHNGCAAGLASCPMCRAPAVTEWQFLHDFLLSVWQENLEPAVLSTVLEQMPPKWSSKRAWRENSQSNPAKRRDNRLRQVTLGLCETTHLGNLYQKSTSNPLVVRHFWNVYFAYQMFLTKRWPNSTSRARRGQWQGGYWAAIWGVLFCRVDFPCNSLLVKQQVHQVWERTSSYLINEFIKHQASTIINIIIIITIKNHLWPSLVIIRFR